MATVFNVPACSKTKESEEAVSKLLNALGEMCNAPLYATSDFQYIFYKHCQIRAGVDSTKPFKTIVKEEVLRVVKAGVYKGTDPGEAKEVGLDLDKFSACVVKLACRKSKYE